MKKQLILSCLLGMTSVCAMAQLTIENSGEIKAHSTLKIYGKSTQGYSESISCSRHGLYINNNGKGNPPDSGNEIRRYGLHIINTLANDTTNMGIFIYPDMTRHTNTNEYGILSCAGNSSHGSYGIYGGFYKPLEVTNGVGVYGSSKPIWIIPPTYSGVYAAFFNGNVRVANGDLTANLLTPSAMLSGERSAEFSGVEPLSASGVSEKLGQVQLLRLNRIVEFEEECMEAPSNSEGDAATDNSPKTILRKTSMASLGYGLAADQLRKVYPELVYEDQNGNMSINYIEMIPLLVQAINELKAEVEELKKSKK